LADQALPAISQFLTAVDCLILANRLGFSHLIIERMNVVQVDRNQGFAHEI